MLDSLGIWCCYFRSRFALRKHRAATYENLIKTCSHEDVDRYLDGTLLLKAIEYTAQNRVLSQQWHEKAIKLHDEIQIINKKWDCDSTQSKKSKGRVLEAF